MFNRLMYNTYNIGVCKLVDSKINFKIINKNKIEKILL